MRRMFRERCLEIKEAFEDVFFWFQRHFCNICNCLIKLSISVLLAFTLYAVGYQRGVRNIQTEMARFGVAEYICDPETGEVTWVISVETDEE